MLVVSLMKGPFSLFLKPYIINILGGYLVTLKLPDIDNSIRLYRLLELFGILLRLLKQVFRVRVVYRRECIILLFESLLLWLSSLAVVFFFGIVPRFYLF